MLAAEPLASWGTLAWAEGSRGVQRAKVRALRCRRVDGDGTRHVGWLIGQRPAREQTGDRKCFWSNASARTPIPTLVEYAHRRHWIEQYYEEAKGELGWDQFQGRRYDAFHRNAVTVMLSYSFLIWLEWMLIHNVGNSYLTPFTRRRVVDDLLQLRRERVPGRAELHIDAAVASPGTALRGTFKVWNQNGRRILGRHPNYEWFGGHVTGDEPLTQNADQPDYFTARAGYPDSLPQDVRGFVMPGLIAKKPVKVPVLDLPIQTSVEGRSTWEFVYASQGDPGTNPSYTPGPPADEWDGSQSDCVRNHASPADFGWIFYYKRLCYRNYKVDFAWPDTIPGGAQVRYSQLTYIDAQGRALPPGRTAMAPPVQNGCVGAPECYSAVMVELTDQYYHVLARSTVQPFPPTTVLSSRTRVPLASPKLPAFGSRGASTP